MERRQGKARDGSAGLTSGTSGNGDQGKGTRAEAGDRRQCRVQPGLTGTNAGLEQGGSVAVGTTTVVARRDRA